VSFRLTREVRFAIDRDHHAHPSRGANTYAAQPSLMGMGHYFALAITLAGEVDAVNQYVADIKFVDKAARERAISLVADAVLGGKPRCPNSLIAQIFERLDHGWNGPALDSVRLSLSPFVSVRAFRQELPMTRYSENFEFAASHRLHNPQLSDEENRKRFGKCNNPNGHGHNYQLQVTLRGKPREAELLIDVPALEKIVKETVVDRFDHKNLNLEVAEFREVIPTVENISMVIFRMLKNRFGDFGAELASVTVWETSKTWSEYSED
jgi:6-pyruvoyltetrahydropterin/6-carboxytetrahydropterin synthase